MSNNLAPAKLVAKPVDTGADQSSIQGLLDQIAAGAPQMLQAVDQAAQVGVHQITGTLPITGMNAWFRRTFDHQVDRPDGVQILLRPYVAVLERHTTRP